jgi:hypothetical protein
MNHDGQIQKNRSQIPNSSSIASKSNELKNPSIQMHVPNKADSTKRIKYETFIFEVVYVMM